jgi:SNF2 family DNA or RNA helicase
MSHNQSQLARLPPLDHQPAGADFIGQLETALLLDDPGMCKTSTFIMALDKRQEKFGRGMRGWVVCPAVARGNWLDEFRMWSEVERRYVVADDIHDIVAWEKELFDVGICSYEFARGQAHRFHKAKKWFDFMCLDEIHRVKSPTSARTLAIIGADCESGISQWALWRVGLSGTISPNDPMDLYNPLRWTGVIKCDRETFKNKYFTSVPKGKKGSSQKAIKEMVPELRALMSKVAIRRTLDDTNIKLPRVLFSNRLIQGDKTELLQFLAEQPQLSAEIREAIDKGDLALIKHPSKATVRRLIGEAKALPYAKLITEEIKEDGKGKLVVMAYHKKAIETINTYLNEHGVRSDILVGGMPLRQSDAVRKGFQNENKLDVIVVNYETGGEAITLTAAHRLDNFERAWTPGRGDQVNRRIQRQGQKGIELSPGNRFVLIRTITLKDSYDEDVNRIIDDKNDIMEELGLRMLCETGEVEEV